MIRRLYQSLLVLSATLFAATTAMSGYTLLPNGSLLNQAGTSVKTWSNVNSYSAYLTDSGTILYGSSSGGGGGGGAPGGTTASGPGSPYSTINEASWSGTALRSWTWAPSTAVSTTTSKSTSTIGTFHHAFNTMTNGHWLAVGYEYLTSAQLSSGYGVTYSGTVWNEHIIEYDPTTAAVVWEWNAANHMTTTNNARLINVGKFSANDGDVMHFNSVSYDPIHNLIMVSSHKMNEVLVIEHTTTTAIAATHAGGTYGKGGDILFRYGKAANYGGTSAAVFNVVHGGKFVPANYTGAGNLLCFSNNDVKNTYSTAYEIAPSAITDSGFTIGSNGEFVSSVIFSWDTSAYNSHDNFGSVQRLPNGNTFIDFTKSNRLIELNDKDSIVLNYSVSSQPNTAMRYAIDFAGLANLTGISSSTTKSSSSSSTITNSSSSGTSAIKTTSGAVAMGLQTTFRNSQLNIEGMSGSTNIRVADLHGRVILEQFTNLQSISIPTANWKTGTYMLQISQNGKVWTRGLGITR